jgi:hypothetical protein
MADAAWQKTFRDRMHHFEGRRSPTSDALAVSIKIRVASGCFHREHSPRAYELIDKQVRTLSPANAEFSFEEHESGPELLVYLAMTTAGITLATKIIELVIAIIKARSEGVKKGDQPAEPLELIVRRMQDGDKFQEDIVLRIGSKDPIDPDVIEKKLNTTLRKLTKKKKKGV